MIIYIYNNYNCHYEIVYNVIHKYNEIIKKSKNNDDIIYIHLLKQNPHFIEIVNKEFNNVFFKTIDTYDYYINTTIYEASNIQNKKQKIINDEKHFYISHEIFETNNKNIFFATPIRNNNYLECNVLPFQNEIYDHTLPVYIIQGSIDNNRRCYELLKLILDNSYEYDFIIKIIGYTCSNSNILINELHEYKNHKIVIKTDLNFIDFHREFLECYCLLPLTSKIKTPQYYNKKLTSSINYTIAYNLNCIIDEDLQNIYNLKNAYIYNTNIVESFKKSLHDFYNNRRYKCSNM